MCAPWVFVGATRMMHVSVVTKGVLPTCIQSVGRSRWDKSLEIRIAVGERFATNRCSLPIVACRYVVIVRLPEPKSLQCLSVVRPSCLSVQSMCVCLSVVRPRHVQSMCVLVFECAIDVCASQRVQSMHRLHVTCLLVARAPAPWSSPLFLHRCHGEEGSCSCDIRGFDATSAGVPEGHFIYSLARV